MWNGSEHETVRGLNWEQWFVATHAEQCAARQGVVGVRRGGRWYPLHPLVTTPCTHPTP